MPLPKPPRHACIALLAASITLAAGAEVQLLPAGSFAARDGRPGNGLSWQLDDVAGHALASALTAQSAKTAFVFDYDHQTIRAEANGQPAPAAGWATQFEWRAGQGLWATDVRWTEAALQRITAGEYRYVSPVIAYAKASGQVVGVQMAAITNFPALLGMDPLGQALMAQLQGQFTTDQEHDVTLLASLIAALGLAAETTDTQALDAVKALKAEAGALKDKAGKPTPLSGAILTALGLKAGADETAALSAITTLKGSDTAALQAIDALKAQVVTLQAEALKAKVEGIVDAALSAGKLTPAQKAWAVSMGIQQPKLLEDYLASAPVLASLKAQTGGVPPGGSDSEGGEIDSAALAAKAVAWQAEQARNGITVTTAQAVAHVSKTPDAKA